MVSDTNQYAKGIPGDHLRAARIGLYGSGDHRGRSHDLHSGLYGGAVPNPANVLCELLATLHDRDGRVNIRGFYDKVMPIGEEERAIWANLPQDEKQFAAELKLSALSGEVGYSALERMWARPTCDINGLNSGYQGPGAKTVIPSTGIGEGFDAAGAGPGSDCDSRCVYGGAAAEVSEECVRLK